MPLPRASTVLGQGVNHAATRRAAYEPVQVTLDHLRPTLNGRAFYRLVKKGRSPFFYPVPPPHPRYRIPFWNIAPGDQVRIREAAASVPEELCGRVGTVQHVDRLYNRVFLRERVFKRLVMRHIDRDRVPETEPDAVEVEVHRGILYGDLQLIIGKYDLEEAGSPYAMRAVKTEPGKEGPATRQLVAGFVAAKRRRWDPRQLRFLWDRIPSRVRAVKPDSRELEPYLVSTPVNRDDVKRPRREGGSRTRRVPWPHEQGYAEGAPIEGTIAVEAPPPPTPVFDTMPEDALRATWEPPDLRAVWRQLGGLEHAAELDAHLPEMQPRYDPEFGHTGGQRRRRRLAAQRVRYRVRRWLRAKRFGHVREPLQLEAVGGWRGPHGARSLRPPDKARLARIAAGRDPDKLFGAEGGPKEQGVWPS